MNRSPIYVCFTLFLFILTACAPAPAPAPEPEDTTEADIEAIEASVAEWLAAWNAADSATLSSLYTDDAILMPPDGPNIQGREPVGQFWQDNFDEFTGQQTATAEEVRVLGDMAFARGTYQVVRTPKAGGEEEERSGKFFDLYERQLDGSWKLSRHTWNRPVQPESN